jgi:hypothetical protein
MWERLQRLRIHLAQAQQTNLVTDVESFLDAKIVVDQTYQVKVNLAMLRRLRAGQLTNVIEHLEAQLDDGITSLSHFTNEFHEDVLKTLQASKEYRAKFPRKTDSPETDAEVARNLDLEKPK